MHDSEVAEAATPPRGRAALAVRDGLEKAGNVAVYYVGHADVFRPAGGVHVLAAQQSELAAAVSV